MESSTVNDELPSFPNLPDYSIYSIDDVSLVKRPRLSTEPTVQMPDTITPLKLHPTRNAVKAAFNSNFTPSQMPTALNSAKVGNSPSPAGLSRPKGFLSTREKLSQMTPLKLHPMRNSVNVNTTVNTQSQKTQISGTYSQSGPKPTQHSQQSTQTTGRKFENVPKIVLPSCEQHKKQCLMREVRKDGPNKNKSTINLK